MRLMAGLFWSLAFLGCGMNEDKFEEKYAEAYCEWLDGCAKLSDRYGELETCVKAEKIFADETLTPDECKFNKNSAKACLKAIKDNDSCVVEGSVPDECLEVADCSLVDTGAE